MKKMIKGLIAIIFCIMLLSGCDSKENNAYVILNVRDNIADTVRAGHYYMYISKTGSGYVKFYNYHSPVHPDPAAVYTFNTDFPIIIKEVY